MAARTPLPRRSVTGGQLQRTHGAGTGGQWRRQLEITIFGLRQGPDRDEFLFDALRRSRRPSLAELLQPGEAFVDLAVVRDRFLGHTSYLTIKTTTPATTVVRRLAQHYNDAYLRYRDRAFNMAALDDFHQAVARLLAQPSATI